MTVKRRNSASYLNIYWLPPYTHCHSGKPWPILLATNATHATNATIVNHRKPYKYHLEEQDELIQTKICNYLSHLSHVSHLSRAKSVRVTLGMTRRAYINCYICYTECMIHVLQIIWLCSILLQSYAVYDSCHACSERYILIHYI